jgi:beta-lactamase regulating signal transducer with metallopeptidase domain
LNATLPSELSEDEADIVLRHELMHTRQGDLVLNPLLWLAFFRVSAAYGQTLLKMETAFPPSGLCLGFVGILQRGSLMRDRIQSIIAKPKLTALLKATLALGIVGLTVLGLAKAAAPVAPEKAEETSLLSSQVKFPNGGNWGAETNGLRLLERPILLS